MPDLTHGTSVLLDSAALDAEALSLPGLASGASMRVLRRHGDGSLRSLVADLPAGWHTGPLAGRTAQQGYVLAGALNEGDATLDAGTFFFHPAGHGFAWHTPAPVRLILIFEGAQTYAPAGATVAKEGAIRALKPHDVPVTPSLIAGKASGVIRRVLWRDSVTGADTRHLTLPRGLAGLGAEWHPCNEEIFCLTREPVAGDAGPLREGSYLFNPAYAVHGGNRTVNPAETTLLEWHDGLWEIHRYEERDHSS